MTPDVLRDKLIASAQQIGWSATIEPDFVSPKFRGRQDASAASLPENTIGLRLGAYPALVGPIALKTSEDMQVSLKALHNQMVIARSYMRAEEVINAHIMLCVTTTGSQADWRGIIDLAERDETVCRKVIWMPDADALDTSYEHFLARTFLAQPWRSLDAVLNAPLDHNQGLAERILVRHGLSEPAAERWVKLADTYKDDPDGLIPQLVAAREQAE
ncbi:ABC-three component system middle component 1 [Methylobacterium sp. E-045]|uniref:ABC-three component system middle component 1 n=1 Tax=Methylobacterium sp. E-045 TaxID=2836575 RepID=UPI001FBACD04|nr:ABC-three component system middle component 1 [Methylobacterium sp. E-045]MCJ2130619.1 hypothetical protein [Methylobacterium sp. E-045]